MTRIYSTIIISAFLILLTGQYSVVNAQEVSSSSMQPVVNKYAFSKQQKYLTKKLKEGDIEVVQYGALNTIVLPTDRFITSETGLLSEDEYLNFYYIAQYIRTFHPSVVHVSSFTDDVGSEQRKAQLTQSNAQEISNYLAINGIPEQFIQSRGYKDRYDIADNSSVYGSAMNRRIVIQWSF